MAWLAGEEQFGDPFRYEYDFGYSWEPGGAVEQVDTIFEGTNSHHQLVEQMMRRRRTKRALDGSDV